VSTFAKEVKRRMAQRIREQCAEAQATQAELDVLAAPLADLHRKRNKINEEIDGLVERREATKAKLRALQKHLDDLRDNLRRVCRQEADAEFEQLLRATSRRSRNSLGGEAVIDKPYTLRLLPEDRVLSRHASAVAAQRTGRDYCHTDLFTGVVKHTVAIDGPDGTTFWKLEPQSTHDGYGARLRYTRYTP